ncbi:C4-dicarboxylate transporter DcuC [Parasutterella sp.]|uniref:C4-dicarboxylate transporter DcuC n=1 Tax=Parasutterella sp. TaxID=2049037 RepID=UPI00352091F8
MISVVVAAIATVIAGWLLIKRYQTQMVLLVAGLAIIYVSVLCGVDSILPKGAKATGFIGFDPVELISAVSAKQLTGVGLIIMVSGGFAGYMSQIGASNALVKLVAEPLKKISSPYLLLAIAYILGQCINLVIVSAAGLTMLLLVSFYPILLRLGVSRAAAASTLVCSCGIAAGPLFGTQQLAAKTVGMDPTAYFVEYQLICGLPAMLTIAVALYFVQRYFDKKNDDVYSEAIIDKKIDDRRCPSWYAIFPFVPIVLLFVFSKFGISSIRLNVNTSLFLTWLTVMVIEMIRRKDINAVFKDAVVMFKKMGQMFGGIVALVICAEVFATSLRVSGLIQSIIDLAYSTGFGVTGMTGVLTILVGVITTLTGSGVGAFASFASLANDVHNSLGGDLPAMVVPMHLASSVFRSMSPVAGCVIAAAAAAGISPMAICRRTWLPLCLGFLVIFISNLIFNMGML